MPRTLSAALQTQLSQTITSVGYLVQVGLSTVQHWSNIGAVTWNAINWADTDFVVAGLTFTQDADLTATLTIQNVDGVAGALFLAATEHMYSTTVTIYQFARGALATGDVPLIAVMGVDSCQVTDQSVVLQLTDLNIDAAYSPRRTIAPTSGFNFAAPDNAVITWGNEIMTLAPSAQ